MEKEWTLREQEMIAKIFEEDVDPERLTMYRNKRNANYLIVKTARTSSYVLRELIKRNIYISIFANGNEVEIWLSK